jgi:hypothetical protein
MKFIKDLAELNHVRISQDALLKLNRLIEDMRIMTINMGMLPKYFEELDKVELITETPPIPDKVHPLSKHYPVQFNFGEIEQNVISNLFNEIKHGDEGHQVWLKQKLESFFKVEIKIEPMPMIIPRVMVSKEELADKYPVFPAALKQDPDTEIQSQARSRRIPAPHTYFMTIDGKVDEKILEGLKNKEHFDPRKYLGTDGSGFGGDE